MSPRRAAHSEALDGSAMDNYALLLPALGGLIAIAGGLFLIRADRYARQPATAERGLSPIYLERGGARFDALNWTVPFVRVATFQDFVAISCVTHQIVLRRGDVKGIVEEQHWGSRGIRVDHTRDDVPSIILWPRDPERLQAALKDSLLAHEARGTLAAVSPASGEGRQGSGHRHITLLAAARVHWRSFAPAWLFPFVFLYGGLASEASGHEQSFFLLIAAPLFFWSFFRATRPLRQAELEYWPCVFWAIIVPFLVWGAAVFSRLLVLSALRGPLGTV